MLVRILSAIVLAFSWSTQGAAQVTPVESVDLSRYLGTWYEIASIPQSFQKQCVRNTRAEYSNAEGELIRVINSCERSDGSRSVAEGRAKIVDPETNAKLRVTFVRLITWIFAFGGDYWILDLQSDYDYAVVGHPNLTYGWILSRTPSLDHNALENIATNLTAQGYDLCSFNMTRQDGGFDGTSITLCEYLKSIR